jgi:hypothetical protein
MGALQRHDELADVRAYVDRIRINILEREGWAPLDRIETISPYDAHTDLVLTNGDLKAKGFPLDPIVVIAEPDQGDLFERVDQPEPDREHDQALAGDHHHDEHEQRECRNTTSSGTDHSPSRQDEPSGDHRDPEREHAGQQDVPAVERRDRQVEQGRD